MPRYRTTIDSRARDTASRWKHNAKFRRCVCGAEKAESAFVCRACWFAAPDELRAAFGAAIGHAAKNVVGLKIYECARTMVAASRESAGEIKNNAALSRDAATPNK